MKRRLSFVSNSSSASFIVDRSRITNLQTVLIEHHEIVGEWLGMEYTDSYPWCVETRPGLISLSTFMDNFDMSHFLGEIGVPDEAVIKNHD